MRVMVVCTHSQSLTSPMSLQRPAGKRGGGGGGVGGEKGDETVTTDVLLLLPVLAAPTWPVLPLLVGTAVCKLDHQRLRGV